MFKADSFAGAGCKKRVSRLQFNILDDSLKLCTGFGSFCKRNKIHGMGFCRACGDYEFMSQPCWLLSCLQHGPGFNACSAGPGWFIFLPTWLSQGLHRK